MTRLERALGAPMTLPRHPHLKTWSCPVCGVGPDSLLVVRQGQQSCSGSNHTQAAINAAIDVLIEVADLIDGLTI